MNGAEWVRSSNMELSPFGEQVADLLNEVFDGIYHISDAVWKMDFTNPHRITMTIYESGQFATYDSDYLTRLVLLAHARNIRVTVRAATHAYLKFEFMVVDRRGFFAERHPTLAESLQKLGLVV